MKCVFLCFALLLYLGSSSQPLQTAPFASRTGAYGNTHPAAFHFLANQAALGNVKHFEAAIYGEKRFLLQALSLCQVAAALPVGNGAFGLQMAFAGDADFNTSKLGFAYGRKLGAAIDIGIQFSYFAAEIRGYGTSAQLTAEAGLLVHFSEVLHAGFQVCHPAGIAISKTVASLPAIYTVGLQYEPSQQVTLTAEMVKTATDPVALQAGLAYRFAPQLRASAGINSRTSAFYIGAGFQLKRFDLEVVGSVHPHLGVSPGILLQYHNMGK